MAEMAKSDKYAAVVFVSAKPLDPFIKRKWPEGFRFLPVPLTEKLEEYYMPAQLEAADYPGLIPREPASRPSRCRPCSRSTPGPRERALPALTRFVDRLFERLPKLQTEARLPREMEGAEPRRQRAGLAALPPGAGQARGCSGCEVRSRRSTAAPA